MGVGSKTMKLGIAKKLFILFFFFILIFYGTVLNLFIKAQHMSKTSARIVSINNQIASLSKSLQDNLVDMDINNKKFKLLKNSLYFDYFETARNSYNKNLNQIASLDSDKYPISDLWAKITQTYRQYTQYRSQQDFVTMPEQWASENLITQWMSAIVAAKKNNESRIERALIQINDQSRQIVQNGVIGFGISIIVGLLGMMFISRSILLPLKKLKTGLKNISNDNYAHTVTIQSSDEFSELAGVFNDMSRQLKEDEDIRSDFIATLSHEIRTPLSSIQESVNMIIEELLGPVNEKQKKFLKIANSEIIRITSLLNHLMDTSMLESHSGPINPKPLEPNELVQEAALRLSSMAKINHVKIISHPLMDAPLIRAEKKEIMQVLLNIMGNALKFSFENGQVDICLEKKDGDDFLIFNISDTGPGIPNGKQSLIFKKYYRAKEVRDHMSGVGLGLNISKRIVQSHGGNISVENNEGNGCTFSFTLPVHQKSQP